MAETKGRYVNLPTPSGVQRWRIAYRKQRHYGTVDWDARTIWLRPNQSREELADTLIHECAHVATGLGDGQEPSIEAPISRIAQGSTAALLRMGLLVVEGDD